MKKAYIIALICVLLCLFCVIPFSASAATVSSFQFSADMFSAHLDGYESFIIYQYSGSYYITWFNEADVSSFTVANHNTSNFKITGIPSGQPYYVFANSTDCFTYARYNTSSCNAASLIESKKSCTVGYLYFAKSGVLLTNSPALTAAITDYGLDVDYSYYMYFNNVDSKEYVICAITVNDVASPLVVLASDFPQYNSDTGSLTCASNMYIFNTDTVENCVEFLSTADGVNVSSITKSKSIANISRFYYSSANIIDVVTNSVHFYATGIDGTTEDPSGSGILTPEENAQAQDIFDQVKSFIQGIGDWFSWLPPELLAVITAMITTLVVFIGVLVVLKILGSSPL